MSKLKVCDGLQYVLNPLLSKKKKKLTICYLNGKFIWTVSEKNHKETQEINFE